MGYIKQKFIKLALTFSVIAGLSPLLELPGWGIGIVAIAFLLALVVWGWWDLRSPDVVSLTKVDKFSSSYDHLIFVYGSLLVKDSLLRTIHQKPSSALECIPCLLHEHKLEWGACSNKRNLLDKGAFAIQDGSLWASLIAVSDSASEQVEGAVIGVSHKGLVALKNREVNYRLEDVTRLISKKEPEALLPEKKISAFLPSGDSPGKNADVKYIRKKYFRDISLALKSLGFSGLKKPPGFVFREAYLINEIIEKHLRSKAGEKSLLHVYESISRDMTIAQETRNIAYSLSPLIFPRPIFQEIIKVAEISVNISGKSLGIFNAHEEWRKIVGYGKEDKEFLTCAINKKDTIPKIARVDMAMSGNRLLILEMNTDSPGGMRHLDILSTKQTEISKHPSLKWIEGRSYQSSNAVSNVLESACKNLKRAAIVEFKPEEWPTYPEMQFFQEILNNKGISCQIVNLQENALVLKEGKLFTQSENLPLNLIYKRILWQDFAHSHKDSKDALSQAYLSGAVSVVNSLGSRMAGNKLILAILKMKNFSERIAQLGNPLTADEKLVIEKNFPITYLWGDAPELAGNNIQQSTAKDEITADANEYVLKSFHGFGGEDIVIGCEQETPYRKFQEKWNKGYIVQEYIPHGKQLVPIYQEGKVKWEYHYYVIGAYVINGKCVAIEAKTSPTLPINMTKGSYRTAVFPTLTNTGSP